VLPPHPQGNIVYYEGSNALFLFTIVDIIEVTGKPAENQHVAAEIA